MRVLTERIAYSCDRCGWKRRCGTTMDWQKQVIDHPIYGRIANGRLVTLDINSHDCDGHMSTIYRLHEADRRRCEAAA